MATYKSLTNAKLLKCSFDGTSIVGTVTDSNSPQWLEDELWTGSRFKEEDNETIVQDDVVLTVKTRPSYAAGKSLVTSLFETAGSVESSGFFNGFTKYSLPTEPSDIDVVVDYVVDTVAYEDCKVNTLMITGTQSGPIEVEVGLLGKERDATTASTVTAPTAARPAIMADAAIAVGGTTYAVNGFTINLSQAMESDFNNSLTRDSSGLGVFEGTVDITLNMNSDTYTTFFSTLEANTAVSFGFKTVLAGNGFGVGCNMVLRGQPFSAVPETGFWKPTLTGFIRGSDVYGYTITA